MNGLSDHQRINASHHQQIHSAKEKQAPKCKAFKLLSDPCIIQGAGKVYRYDGRVPNDATYPTVQVRDPRPPLTRIWSRMEVVELSVPKFKIDANYVGAPPPLEVSVTNINDNIDKTFLAEMVHKCGEIEELAIFYHPRTNKHLGIAQLVFRHVQGARACVEKFNHTSVMGNVLSVFLDPFGAKVRQMYTDLLEDRPVPREEPPPAHEDPLAVWTEPERADSGSEVDSDVSSDDATPEPLSVTPSPFVSRERYLQSHQLYPYPPPPGYQVYGPPAPASAPEPGYDDVLPAEAEQLTPDRVAQHSLDQVVKELKQILKKDFNKRMIENTAYKQFEKWWDDQAEQHKARGEENRTQGGSALPVKRSDLSSLLENNRGSLSGAGYGLGFRMSLPKMPSFRRKPTRPSPPPEPAAPRGFGKRDVMSEMALLYEFLTRGLSLEDIDYLHRCYEGLLGDDQNSYWLNDTHWVDHAATDRPEKRRRLNEPAVHRSGCARTEGYYKVTQKDKMNHKYHFGRTVAETAVAALADGRDQGSTVPDQRSKAVTAAAISREARNNQRRILTVLGGETESELLKLNQLKFRKKQLKFGKSAIHDWGLFALEPIAADEMVIEYVGQHVRQSVADQRELVYERQGIGSSYLFRIDRDNIIDATKCGNLARFINHSCTPNCYAKIVSVEGQKKIVIYSKQPIGVNEEITYDYKFPYEEVKIPCLCGTPQCRGYLN
ncbi:histone-lysine N-methyltransferase SETD1-like [Pollicipes pollicipes]|uniref:histone-lysine N-methyltransferase SETD1-like n=1 Tax=Pollicipes pollicipes TaxID=41117 RepID=UPI0018859A80|nr:histone-lysine N-methyltransferase SETD1-like [Pollicipes pollicipes]